MFTSLHHLIDLDWMHEAYRRTRKDGAVGVDGVTAADYETELEANLISLLNRIKVGSYYAPPVRRHYIPKADGRKRPLGIPTLEDKVAQRTILMLLEPIYEADFLPCSYGFRPGRSAHDALDALRSGIMVPPSKRRPRTRARPVSGVGWWPGSAVVLPAASVAEVVVAVHVLAPQQGF